MPRDGKGWPGDSYGVGGDNSCCVCNGDGDGGSNGYCMDVTDGSGFVASYGDNAGEQVRETAMAIGSVPVTATTTGMVGTGCLW